MNQQQQSSISSDLIRGHIDTIILYTLIDSDKFAQEISDAVELKSENQYKINQATLYSSLKRLETTKCVKSYWNDSENGRRKFFSLTDKGKKFVEDNLNNWSYSRSIIDKLMDCAPSPVYKTQYVDRIVEVPKEVVKEVIREVPVEKLQIQDDKSSEIKNSPSDAPIKNDSINNAVYTENQSNKEVNYKNILNGLIKVQIQPEEKINEDIDNFITESKKTDNSETENIKINEKSEKADFNKTISENYTDHRIYSGKIDYGDMALKAAKEGYKLRVSSKYSYMSNGTLLLNRLNLFSSMIIYLLAIVEFLFYSTVYKSTLNINALTTFLIILGLTVFPVVMLVIYLKQPLKSTTKKIGTESIFTSAIIVFNIIIITFALALLLDFDFTNVYTSILAIAVPITICVDVFLYYLIRFFISKQKIFNVTKKTA